jgi:prepilin peptidase CpaA
MNTHTLMATGHVLLACLLLIGVYTDLKSRTLPNWLTGAVAALSPIAIYSLYVNNGWSLWPDVAIHLGIAAFIFCLFLLCFAFNMMGGGDVKLITALALWLPILSLLQMLIVMSFFGLYLTFLTWLDHRARGQKDKIKVPYGVAICVGTLWVISKPYLNHLSI